MFVVDDSEKANRLTIHRLNVSDSLDSFAHDVHVGLTSNPKQLPPKYFYDDLGSHLFEAICRLPEYYVTRAENEIISAKIEEIVNGIGIPARRPVRLLELGSGSANKTRHFIELLIQRGGGPLHYLPIDISSSSLKQSSKALLLAYPQLHVTAYAADYSSALTALQRADSDEASARTIVLFFGSSIGNLNPAESAALLREVRTILHPGDALLIGADLKKSSDVLVPAYDDALGVTAAFNLNLLVRINRELDADFELGKFEHRALYNEEHGRIEMHLFSLKRQVVKIGGVKLKVDFDGGESIHTENSYKFDMEGLQALAANSGYHLGKVWFDNNRWFSFNLFTAL